MKEKLSVNRILNWLETDYRTIARAMAERHKTSPITPSQLEELQILMTVTNTFHVISLDPDGFKAFAAQVYRRSGPLQKRTGGLIEEIEAMIAESQKAMAHE